MYKITILTALFISNNLYAMDNMHDHNSKQHDHTSHVAVDGSKTKLDDEMYNNFNTGLLEQYLEEKNLEESFLEFLILQC